MLVMAMAAFGYPALGQDFYDVNTVHTIQLVFPQSNWDHILDSLYAEGDEERLLGTAYIDGVEFDSVGVRYKGNSTYSPNRVKNPFNIKLDYIIDDQLIDGYGTLKLANSWNDPSFVREVLSYEIARKYMPACLSNYVNVYVNGALIGLYVSVQDVDNLFLRTHFGGSSGACFKGDFEGLMGGTIIWGYLGTDSVDYMGLYELESDEGWAELMEFLDTLNNYTDAVGKVLDIDRHLWMLAFDILLVNLDSPVNMAHNFYLYQDATNRFNPIIWDLNMSFGGFTQVSTGGTPSVLNILQMQQLAPLFNSASTHVKPCSQIFPNSNYQRRYLAHLKTILQENFANSWYKTRAYELQGIIDAHVQADPYKLYSYSAFLTNVATSVTSGQTICGIAQLMDQRTEYLNDYPALEAIQPAITNVTADVAVAWPNSTVWITASVVNADDVVMAYRGSSGERFFEVTMADDGAHHDGPASDRVYGASVTAGYNDIQYYVYAENEDIGAFAPERAEFEVYTLPVAAGGLIINEFMASNAATLADPSGEYDDWVELLNSSGSAIYLEGYYMSDNAATPTKWAFPAVTIQDGEHLLIWADEDLEQDGIHAGFKLSASGEILVLSDPFENVVDEVVFGVQDDDVSLGRCPDGTGEFVVQESPSPAAPNACGGAVIDLVINEFMASNGVTISDPAGEYEDWIEVHNRGESPVELQGYYLSDDASAPTKWTFPAVAIEAGEYLIVWADEDLTQEGVHADFKLSASGETIVLSDPVQNVVDQVVFGAQVEDVSVGRCPNITGDFGEMAIPTPGAVNACGDNCCRERTGDADGVGGDEPTIGDISAIIDAVFITADQSPIACMTEADVNQSGGAPRTIDDLTIGDISILISYLFIRGPYDVMSNPDGTVLPECL